MRGLILITQLLIFGTMVCQGQLIVQPILKPQYPSPSTKSISKAYTPSPAKLPFWDDFSMTKTSPDSIRIWEGDTASQWNYELSKDVYVNASLAINPPTYNVATLDGLDANGGFHAGLDVGLADQLVSDTINLQGKANVVLSFYWQAGGFVELPDEGDSLILQFYSPNIKTNGGWETVWSMDGGNLLSDQDSIFTQVAQQVGSVFLTQRFVFRFQSYGDKDGPFDAWHIDYILLDDKRANDDLYYEDIALSRLTSSPFTPFYSMPVNQFMQNVSNYQGSVSTIASALEKPDVSGEGIPARYKLELNELVTSTFIDSVDFGDQPTIPVNEDPFREQSALKVSTSSFDLSTLPNQDSLILESKVYIRDNIDTLFNPLNIDQFNDTIRTKYPLHNYYAYDDGTAEYAAGTNINGGQVAVMFWLESSDTLTAIDIHFPNIAPVSGGSPIELRVFLDLDSDPIRSQTAAVINGESLNAFTRYILSAPLVLPADTFYVGFLQNKNEYIGIGFDRSNPQAYPYIYENKTGIWEQNTRLKGALMIRPVFGTVSSPVLKAGNKEEVLVYPNPTKDIIFIEGEYESIKITDFSGRVWMSQKKTRSHDFSNLSPGLYLLTIYHKNGVHRTLKVIKK